MQSKLSLKLSFSPGLALNNALSWWGHYIAVGPSNRETEIRVQGHSNCKRNLRSSWIILKIKQNKLLNLFPFMQLYTEPYLTFLDHFVSVLSISQSLCMVLTKMTPALRALKKKSPPIFIGCLFSYQIDWHLLIFLLSLWWHVTCITLLFVRVMDI